MKPTPLRFALFSSVLLASAAIAYGTGTLAPFEEGEDRPGGAAATTEDHGRNAFSLDAEALSEQQKTDFAGINHV